MTKSAPIAWSIDPAQGHIQGPLDLAFVDGQQMALALTPNQIALLIHLGQLQAVYLDGHHLISVGDADGQISPSCSLVFLALGEPLRLRWTRSRPLCWGSASDQKIIGSCDLCIDDPSRFFETFLHTPVCPEPEFVTRLIEQLVRGLFENILDDQSASEVQAHLTRFTPDDLIDDLGACGLRCTGLAVYTLAPPIEDGATAEETTHSEIMC